jgi:branched-chain amino acid transport system ATP-binding protein
MVQADCRTQSEAEIRDKVDDVLEFLNLTHLVDERAGNLSGGQKKLLELGRTMMVDAKIVFLDEVGAGVNRTLLNTIGDAIIRLNEERGYTFCMIEHDMAFISRLCDPVIVMAEGKVLVEGKADEVRKDERVIEAYLGVGRKQAAKHEGEAPSQIGSRQASEATRRQHDPPESQEYARWLRRCRYPARLHHHLRSR